MDYILLGTIIGFSALTVLLWSRIHSLTRELQDTRRITVLPSFTEQHADVLETIHGTTMMPVVKDYFAKMRVINDLRADLQATENRLRSSNGQSGEALRAGQVISRLSYSEYSAAMAIYNQRQYRTRAEAAEAKLAKLEREGN